MEKSKFTNEQIAFAIRQAESGTPVERSVANAASASRCSRGGRRSSPE